MQTLPEAFSRAGWQFEQVKRVGDVAIYRKRQKRQRSCPLGAWTFEVIKIQKRKERFVFGKPYPAKESYPSSEQWGDAAWSYPDLEGSEKRFQSLIEAF